MPEKIDGLPNVAVLILMADGAACGACHYPVSDYKTVKRHRRCGSRFVAIGSLVGRYDSRLSLRGDLATVDLRAGRSRVLITADEAEETFREIRSTQPRVRPNLRPGDINNVVRRLATWAWEHQHRYRNPLPFDYIMPDTVELRSVVEYLDGPNPKRIRGVGPKAQEDLHFLLGYLTSSD